LIVSTFNNGTLVRANDPVADASAAAIVKVAALKAQEAVSATLLRVSSPSAQDTLWTGGLACGVCAGKPNHGSTRAASRGGQARSLRAALSVSLPVPL